MANRAERSPAGTRIVYLDWVRILAVLLLVPFHTARIFDTFEELYTRRCLVLSLKGRTEPAAITTVKAQLRRDRRRPEALLLKRIIGAAWHHRAGMVLWTT